MARLSADVDPAVLKEAQLVSGAKTKRETLDRALREFIARRRAQELAGLAGKGLVDMTGKELAHWRSAAKDEQ
jgi:Arc/MetJ family transcription regulator